MSLTHTANRPRGLGLGLRLRLELSSLHLRPLQERLPHCCLRHLDLHLRLQHHLDSLTYGLEPLLSRLNNVHQRRLKLRGVGVFPTNTHLRFLLSRRLLGRLQVLLLHLDYHTPHPNTP